MKKATEQNRTFKMSAIAQLFHEIFRKKVGTSPICNTGEPHYVLISAGKTEIQERLAQTFVANVGELRDL